MSQYKEGGSGQEMGGVVKIEKTFGCWEMDWNREVNSDKTGGNRKGVEEPWLVMDVAV